MINLCRLKLCEQVKTHFMLESKTPTNPNTGKLIKPSDPFVKSARHAVFGDFDSFVHKWYISKYDA